MSGVLARSVATPVPTRHHTELEIEVDLDFEQILMALLSGVKGDVTPSTPGSGTGRLWTFLPSTTGVVAPKTYSMEWVESNFAATPDNIGREALYGFCIGFDITAGIDGISKLTMRMAARKTATTTKTTIALPTLNPAPNAKWKLQVDDTWANLGTTQITGQIYGLSYTFGGFMRPAYYLDGRNDLDFVAHEFAPRTAELIVDIVVDPASTGYAVLEAADKAAQTPRFVRISNTGKAFAAPDGSLNYFLQVDGAYQHAPDSLQDRGADRDGNHITRLHLLSTYDATSGQDVRFRVQNILTAFP